MISDIYSIEMSIDDYERNEDFYLETRGVSEQEYNERLTNLYVEHEILERELLLLDTRQQVIPLDWSGFFLYGTPILIIAYLVVRIRQDKDSKVKYS
ncbi:hypothetical protein [Alkalibacillus haloalkaliphilus]|uniref:Uncharacterized protein n=1 Tax=Alkalibacillus haloalkaliphilus TaxID=94136 RepID=A0A511W581_9BACI|nr:hypothetical protein [Alkalibacillus haloalkaliphilus]GEN46256.1 hypothetical protein AHA02nite_20320 [Alkalibacillus haloalkaliphilus]